MNLQIMWLVNTFRARVVDISEHALTIEVCLLMICAILNICFTLLSIWVLDFCFHPLPTHCEDKYFVF